MVLARGALWILRRQSWTSGKILIAATWYALSVLTPLYHPYARLWLPLQMVGWLIMAGCLTGFPRPSAKPSERAPRSLALTWVNGSIAVLGLFLLGTARFEHPEASLVHRPSPRVKQTR